MKERVKRIKRATVRILINGQPSGTGFVISGAGLIGTCFHVVQHVQAAPNGQTQITYAPSIEVEFKDGNKLPGPCMCRVRVRAFLKRFPRITAY